MMIIQSKILNIQFIRVKFFFFSYTTAPKHMHIVSRIFITKGGQCVFYGLLLGEWNLSLLMGVILLAGLYITMVIYVRSEINYKQTLLFFLCLTLIYFVFGTPITAIVHLSFSLHMIQMSIIYFLIPPLFLLSIPQSLILQVRKTPGLRKESKYLLSPTVALCIFALLFLLYHLPFTLKVLSYYPFVHTLYSICLFFLAMFMWWPVATHHANRRISKLQRKRFVFLSGLLLMPACLIFIINGLMSGMSNPFLDEITASLCVPPSTDNAELLPPPFNTKYDQIAAGLFMMGTHKFGLVLTTKLAPFMG